MEVVKENEIINKIIFNILIYLLLILIRDKL